MEAGGGCGDGIQFEEGLMDAIKAASRPREEVESHLAALCDAVSRPGASPPRFLSLISFSQSHTVRIPGQGVSMDRRMLHGQLALPRPLEAREGQGMGRGGDCAHASLSNDS